MAIEHPTPSDDQSEKATGRRRDISELYGLLKWQGPPLTLEDMQAAIEAGAVARYRRAVGPDIPADDEP